MLYKNHQWRVTEQGLEADPPMPQYVIEASRLTELTKRGGVTYYDWPVHLAPQTWVDIAAFNEAFSRALEYHHGSYAPAVDEELLERSLVYALNSGHRGRAP